jgi:hypothetical protein
VNIMKLKLLLTSALLIVSVGCSTITVTKTSKGFSQPVPPSEVEIIGTVPSGLKFEQIGIVNADIYGNPATGYNKIREKVAPLGANAVFLNNQTTFGKRTYITGTAAKIEK